ncbi:MAG: glutamate--cysteine ligase [Cyanobacteria bacterium J06626_23]
MDFQFGIEHEIAFLRPDGTFADFSNTTFAEFEAIIVQLPRYEQDYAHLRRGDAGIRDKRWYIEGYERFDETGRMVGCVPKGIEIRTTIHSSIEGAIAQLRHSFDQLQAAAAGFIPVLTSFNPRLTRFEPSPPFNAYEKQRQANSPEERTESIPMVTYGPDLNLSFSDLPTRQLVDVARKLTFYSPGLIPFSYSSPFFANCPWAGLSARTFYRTGMRPAVTVYLPEGEPLLSVQPPLTKTAQLPAEVGRIEFKAFDSCGDFELYASLFALLKGLILDKTLTGRATIPDADLHQRSARLGWEDRAIYEMGQRALAAAAWALRDDIDEQLLEPLEKMLCDRTTPAHRMLEAYEQGRSIEAVLERGYGTHQAASPVLVSG